MAKNLKVHGEKRVGSPVLYFFSVAIYFQNTTGRTLKRQIALKDVNYSISSNFLQNFSIYKYSGI